VATPKLDVARREVQGFTAPLERRALRWLAERMPSWVTPDRLTAVGFVAQIGAGVAYALAGEDRRWLHAVNFCLFANWFGDSLDGSIARFRSESRPRYGFYLDHMVDALGAFFLLGGMGLSGLLDSRLAVGLLIVYLLMNINVYLATHTRGVFKISYGAFGGTELRILLALANLAAFAWPEVRVAGLELGLFDVFALFGLLGLGVVLTRSVVQNARFLAEEERLDRRERPTGT
jgi:archaetidylinositol phosphate synthase